MTHFISRSQFGFKSGKSTEQALLKLTGETYNNSKSSKLAASLFVDITKAFDMVDYCLLLKKFYRAGTRGFMYL